MTPPLTPSTHSTTRKERDTGGCVKRRARRIIGRKAGRFCCPFARKFTKVFYAASASGPRKRKAPPVTSTIADGSGAPSSGRVYLKARKCGDGLRPRRIVADKQESWGSGTHWERCPRLGIIPQNAGHQRNGGKIAHGIDAREQFIAGRVGHL